MDGQVLWQPLIFKIALIYVNIIRISYSLTLAVRRAGKFTTASGVLVWKRKSRAD